jgi:phosphate transport system protein
MSGLSPSFDAPDVQLTATELVQLTQRACQVAKSSAKALASAIAGGSGAVAVQIRGFEEELDGLDRQINEGVTATIVRASEVEARELLACLKLIIELERIGDLLLNVSNRLEIVAGKLEAQDLSDLGAMASIVNGMLGNVSEAFARRDLKTALQVLRADAELDRLRNMIFVRHVDNPEREPRREGFHLVFMAQTLERAGDHAKNVAEEICHLVSGRSVRHILREYDRPVEQLFLEKLRSAARKKKGTPAKSNE